jgi:integration host factor subunit beta
MTRSELIDRLAEKQTHLDGEDLQLAVKIMIDQMSSALAQGERIEIRGFGAFSVRHRQPRLARNPRTGEQVLVGEHYIPHFRAGKELRDRVNAGAGTANANALESGLTPRVALGGHLPGAHQPSTS